MLKTKKCCCYTVLLPKFEALVKLYFLTLLIPADSGHFERGLSLALDGVLVGLEALP